MLKIFRKNTRIVIWIIVISFGLWGAGTLVTGSQMLSPYAGEVYGKKIKIREFEKRKKLLKLLLPTEYSTIPERAIDIETFKQIALTMEAKKRGMKADDAEVRMIIEKLLGGEVMSFEGYSRWTKTNLNENPRDFEETLRNAILAQKLTTKLLSEAVPPSAEKNTQLTEEQKKEIAKKNQEAEAKALMAVYLQANIKIGLKYEEANS